MTTASYQAQWLARPGNRDRANLQRRNRRLASGPSDAYRNYKLRKHFNITPERYEEMLRSQNGVCAICKQPETTIWRGRVIRLAVDHDRSCCPGADSCGRCVRGLLCSNCNNGLGRFKDDTDVLESAIAYLRP